MDMIFNAYKRNGFTLIELLVIIAIIGILSTITITSLNGSRRKAEDASFKSIARSIQSVAVLCCAEAATGFLENTLGADICYPAVGSNYPGSENIGSVEIIRDCDSADGFQLKLIPGSENDAGDVSYTLCDGAGCEFFES